MAKPVLLQDTFTRMVTDVPRDELPRDAAWIILDYIPNLGVNLQTFGSGGRLVKRGGWVYVSEDVSTDSTGATSITAMGLLQPQNRLCLTTDNNKFGYITLPADGAENYTQVSTTSIQSSQPYFQYADKLIILNNDGTTAPKSYDGTTFGNLAGSPPTGKFGMGWGDRIIIGNTAANPRRVFFSALGGASWDTTYGYVDMLQTITGFAGLPNAILVFGSDRTTRIRGKEPPPDSRDMVVDDVIFNVGCTFPNSIAVNGPNCIFCNEEGVFMTNGTSLVQDLTELCGIKATWQAYAARTIRTAGASAGGLNNLHGGFIGNYYLAALDPTTISFNIGFLFDLTTMSCVTLSNMNATAVCMTPQIGDELFFAMGKQIAAMSTMWMPDIGGAQDADEREIIPLLETRYYVDTSSGKNRWRHLYLDYQLSTVGGVFLDPPGLLVSYISDPSSITYTSLGGVAGNDLSGTEAATTRAKVPVRIANRGVAFRILQDNASANTVISALSADVYAREGGRVG